LRVLAKMKRLRGTALDVFGYTGERRMERALITQYEADVTAALTKLTPDTKDAIVALAELPLQIRGFGPVKAENEVKAAKRREELLSIINMGGAPMAKAAE
jgi:indolepyruvate ferredoxin oxidoreductase